MMLAKFFQMILVADKSKVLTKHHDEIFDIVYDGLLNNFFINIGLVSCCKFLDIDVIHKIFVLKHFDGF